MRFTENNEFYGQDFRFFRGVPAGVNFKIDHNLKDTVCLVADGHGGNPYGNGKIYVPKENFDNLLSNYLEATK